MTLQYTVAGGDILKRKPITGKNIKPEILLGIAGVLLIIAAFGPWATNLLSVSGWEQGGGKVTLLAGLIMLCCTAVSRGYARFLRGALPVLSVSIVCGLLTLVEALVAWGGLGELSVLGVSAGWGLYLTIIAGLMALLAAYMAHRRGPS